MNNRIKTIEKRESHRHTIDTVGKALKACISRLSPANVTITAIIYRLHELELVQTKVRVKLQIIFLFVTLLRHFKHKSYKLFRIADLNVK